MQIKITKYSETEWVVYRLIKRNGKFIFQVLDCAESREKAMRRKWLCENILEGADNEYEKMAAKLKEDGKNV